MFVTRFNCGQDYMFLAKVLIKMQGWLDFNPKIEGLFLNQPTKCFSAKSSDFRTVACAFHAYIFMRTRFQLAIFPNSSAFSLFHSIRNHRDAQMSDLKSPCGSDTRNYGMLLFTSSFSISTFWGIPCGRRRVKIVSEHHEPPDDTTARFAAEIIHIQ